MLKFQTSPGTPLPFGSSQQKDGVNFSFFSRNAKKASLVLFQPASNQICAEIALDPVVNRTGDVWHICVHEFDLSLRYGLRLDGPFDPAGKGHYFDRGNILIDPYAKALTGGSNWGESYRRQGNFLEGLRFQRRCLVADETFDWEGDRPLQIRLEDSIIYEMHVRGFTCHRSAGVAHPGTYAGVVEKIPYLRTLGITAVELMPVMEFNENEIAHSDPVTGQTLRNFWGYSPLCFFAPKAAFAEDGTNGSQVREFKKMVKALHRAGIEVILDVVFNHTAEGSSNGPVLSFRGLENSIYYLLDPRTKKYLNFSGCGNTLNCNHPVVKELVLDCLRYWVTEMHVDGFRFDLASILGRDRIGKVISDPPMVERIAEDPILSGTKIIAEAWDAGGAYQVGSFSTSARWAEWNGKFRDDVRFFMCGRKGSIGKLATRLAGSSDLYQPSGRFPYNSINFVTSHDGFTLLDLVSYNHKHNEHNGEQNRDGSDYNISWNSGFEGECDDPAIRRLRMRRVRTFAAILFLAQGVPMMLAGDEFGRSQQGNNNAYCQDNETSWVDWRLAEKNKELRRFFRMLIALRKRYPHFRRTAFFNGGGELSWHSASGEENWNEENLCLAFLLRNGLGGKRDEARFYVMLNGDSVARNFVLPDGKGWQWRLLLDTAQEPPKDIFDEKYATLVETDSLTVESMAAVVLIS
ncbi:MAG: glycogen debranching protein GlgX [Deltaproteobacteria bacterium]